MTSMLTFQAHATRAMKGTMMKRLATAALCATAALAPLALVPAGPLAAQTVNRPASELVLSIGRGQMVTVGGAMANVFVANDAIADVQIQSPNQLYVFGKAGGETVVYASNSAGAVIWSANIRVGSNIDSVDQMLRMALPDAKVAVSTMGTGTFLLTGTVASPEDAAEAQRLVQAFVGKEANVITRLKTATPLQVNLRVRFAEVSRTLVRNIGMNWKTNDSTGGFRFAYSQGAVSAATNTSGFALNKATGDSSTVGFSTKYLGMDLLSALDLGETQGLVTTLSEPNLTALSGETADFLAGGEYPIPISQGLGNVSIEYKRFGVSLAYTPTVLANGRISLRVRPEVSELSDQGAITLNGYKVPALTVRRAETTIELGSGQSFMIAGLMGNSAQSTIKKVPGAGDLPILGSLFRSTGFQRGETELVIVVTPYLVQPVDAGDIKLPTDGYQNANILQQTLLNKENDGKSGSDRPKPMAAPQSQEATAPKIGAIEDPALPLFPPAQDSKKKRSGKTAKAETTAPGFSLN